MTLPTESPPPPLPLSSITQFPITTEKGFREWDFRAMVIVLGLGTGRETSFPLPN